VAATAPQETGRMLVIRPYVAGLLAVAALRKIIMIIMRLHHDCNVAKVLQCQNVMWFCCSWQSYEDKRSLIVIFPSKGDKRVVCLLFYANNI
jgi:hypothetical protein